MKQNSLTAQQNRITERERENGRNNVTTEWHDKAIEC